uniref:Glucagon / GIP / secretin / VIP family domain-containing protein n=1 Tax=Labrus bergylta TaxID=56723 RepID=A0A3Q3FFF5_9LABR
MQQKHDLFFTDSYNFKMTTLSRQVRKNIIRNLKRHSDGTFTSDFTHYLDRFKAKDFVEWLKEKEQGRKELLQVHATSGKERSQGYHIFHLFCDSTV